MRGFHRRTLALLRDAAPRARRRADELVAWGRRHGARVPAAFLEWAELDDGRLLRNYSNDDWFYFDEPRLVETPGGGRGLLYHSENQNNFDRIVALDRGDDPPVLSAECGAPPWTAYAERFSDALYAQVFDWQYWLAFAKGAPADKHVTYAGAIQLSSGRCLGALRACYRESVTTRFVAGGREHAEYRFLKTRRERFTVTLDEATGGAEVRFTGRPAGSVAALEAQWLDLLGDEVQPPEFNSVGWALGALGRLIDAGRLVQLRHACAERPGAAAIARLVACHRAAPLARRAAGDFPPTGPRHALGGPAWGVTLRFRRKATNPGWWQLERLDAEGDAPPAAGP